MDRKPFTTLEQQIQLLKSRNLTFLDEEMALQSLDCRAFFATKKETS